MEEDIKILEDLLVECKAIENLLTRYKQLEEENKYYKEIIVEKEINKNFEVLYEKTLKAVKTDYIPKSKVKEKIEELDKRIKSITTEEEYKKEKIYTCKDFNEFITSVLQELLDC